MSKEFVDKLENYENDEPGPTSERWDPLGADNEEESGSVHGINAFDCEIGGYSSCSSVGPTMDLSRIRSLEEEQETLTTSLMALTSHFAQVQFRLRQIVEAPAGEKDQLLKNLEEFAFRGIPEVKGNVDLTGSEEVITNLEHAHQYQFELIERLKRQLTELEKFAYESGAPVLPQSILIEKQKILIDELKNKLNLNVNENDLPQLTNDDLKNQVDAAIGEFVGPFKMKEQLVAQLKTQITDLERFIAFLQCDTEEIKLKTAQDDCNKQTEAYNTYVMKKRHATTSTTTINCGKTKRYTATTQNTGDFKNNHDNKNGKHFSTENISSTKSTATSTSPPTAAAAATAAAATSETGVTQSLNNKAHSLLDKASTILQMFAVSQFGCGSHRAGHSNTLKKTSRINHWGDTRAQLEVDIQEIISLVVTLRRETREGIKKFDKYEKPLKESYYDYSNDSDDCVNLYSGKIQNGTTQATTTTTTSCVITSELYTKNNIELTSIVRRNFAVTLQKLIQHGLRSMSDATVSLVPFIGCLNPQFEQKSKDSTGDFYSSDEDDLNGLRGFRQMHAWELIIEYYNIKNGDEYNETPARKLSQSFNLDIVGTNDISNKQSLLSTIGSIIGMHSPYKRSYNSHFKAFVCAGLNSHKLVQWLNLIFQCTELINTFYTSWSYVAKTGFRDALRSIDRLTKYDFDLPVDLAIRQFQNIKDVFM